MRTLLANYSTQPLADFIMESLPNSVLGFVQLIGLEATLAMVSKFGGAEIRFVKDRSNLKFERISNVIGVDAAMRLADEYNGERWIYIPRCDKALRKIRDREIVCEYDELINKGWSCREAANELAIKHGINYRQIERVVNGSL